MAAPHDPPDLAQLIEAVREWLERDVMTAADTRLRFHARVARNMLAMAERELAFGPDQLERQRLRWERLGVTDDAELAAAIRSGALDDRSDEVRGLVREAVVDKLRVANPDYLGGGDAVCE